MSSQQEAKPLGRHSRRVLELVKKVDRKGGLILDAGAGASPYKPHLKGRVVGMDIFFTPGADVLGSLDALPFADASFDGALCFQVLYYAADPKRWIGELARVVKPGGWLGISVSRPATMQGEAERSGRKLSIWQPSEWDSAIMQAGFKRITPLRERLLWSRLGAYHFGLFAKGMM